MTNPDPITLPRFNVQGRLEHLSDSTPSYVWVPTEQLLLTQIVVPGKGANQWRQALPFVLEESLAQPIEQLHFAVLARENTGERAGLTSIAVVDKSRMQLWVDELKAQGWENSALIPNCFEIPEPEQGVWHQADLLDANQTLIRTGSWQGMRVSPALLPPLIQQAGAKLVTVNERMNLSAQAMRHFNLRQGEFQAQARANATWQAWRGVLVGAILLFALVLGQKAWQTQQAMIQTAEVKMQTESLFKQMFSDVKRVVNVRAQTKSRLKRAAHTESIGPADLFKQVESVLLSQIQRQKIQLQQLQWQNQTLVLNLTAKETRILEQARKAVRELGLQVEFKLKQVNNNQAQGSLYVKAR